MKKYTKLFQTILIISLSLPNLAFASWYNPFSWNIFSWFNKPVEIEVLQVSTSATSTTNIDEIIKAKVNVQVKVKDDTDVKATLDKQKVEQITASGISGANTSGQNLTDGQLKNTNKNYSTLSNGTIVNSNGDIVYMPPDAKNQIDGYQQLRDGYQVELNHLQVQAGNLQTKINDCLLNSSGPMGEGNALIVTNNKAYICSLYDSELQSIYEQEQSVKAQMPPPLMAQ